MALTSICALAAWVLLAVPSVAADNTSLKRGGQLYDNWAKLTGVKTQGNHALYPATAKKSGDSTHRCKECHGWDYIGDKGRYAKGSHYTGIPGVWPAHTQSAEVLTGALTSAIAGHDFSAQLNAADIAALVRFLREGLIDYGAAVGSGGGDAAKGKPLYEGQCSSCHGADGNEMDFKPKKEGDQGVGWLARDNPQESLHKIRWGHPGRDMPSTVVDGGLTAQQTVDLLKYTTTLP